MNMSDPSWHAQLTISGIGTPHEFSGSMIEILRAVVSTVAQSNPRVTISGKRINLILQDKPIEASQTLTHNLVADLEASVSVIAGTAPDELKPRESESATDFHSRLLEAGLSPASALYLANDWFGLEQDSALVKWLSDPMAIQFRKLNASAAAFEAAMPMEYEQLKAHVKERYPQFLEGVTFRTA